MPPRIVSRRLTAPVTVYQCPFFWVEATADSVQNPSHMITGDGFGMHDLLLIEWRMFM